MIWAQVVQFGMCSVLVVEANDVIDNSTGWIVQRARAPRFSEVRVVFDEQQIDHQLARANLIQILGLDQVSSFNVETAE